MTDSTTTALIMVYFLLLKHFLADFIHQPEWMWKNKGTYGHWGGIAHSGYHAVLTYAIIAFSVGVIAALVTALVDFFVHYHVDWGKMKLSHGLTPANELYWVILGLDQLLHGVTYLCIVALALNIGK